MIDAGVFNLKTAGQLFKKLLKDYEHLKENPLDSGGWFNFVVTANHLPEWESCADEAAARKFRDQHAILRICDHLARNAKHFRARESTVRLNAVAATNQVIAQVLIGTLDGTPKRYSRSEVQNSNQDSVREEFTLDLSHEEAKELGVSTITATELADRVVVFWRKRLDP